MQDLRKSIENEKIVAIIRGVSNDKIADTAKALAEGGIKIMEITIDQSSPDGTKRTCEAIETVKSKLPDVHVGAGTVMNAIQARAVHDAGAELIVSPNINIDVIRLAAELNMVSMPGAVTPSEIAAAYECGADYVKIFPVVSLGTEYIKALRGPMGHIKMMAVGGVGLNNMEAYHKAGICGFGIGGSIVNLELINNGEYGKVKEIAGKYVEKAHSLRR